MQAADLAHAEHYAAASDAILDRCNLTPLRWSVMNRRVWRAGLLGRLDEAEQLLFDTREFGCTHGVTQAEHAADIQLAMVRWQQGRVLTSTPSELDAPQLGPPPGFSFLHARFLAGDTATHAAARTVVEDLAQHEFEDLSVGPFWSSLLIVTAESAFLLGLPAVGRAIRRLLEPYIDQVAFSGLWVAAPIAHGAAVAAAAAHDPDASSLFEHAIMIAERVNAPLLRARAQLAWVAATCLPSTPRSRPYTLTLCEEARATARTLELPELARHAEDLRSALLR